MNYSYILFFIICVWLNCVLCAPIESTNSFYDAIVKKCPSVQSDTIYKNHKIFKACKDWKTISEVNKLTQSNVEEIRCLLYFNSFTEYCAKASNVNTSVPRAVLAGYDEDMICDYAKNVAHKNLSEIFSNKDTCISVCGMDLAGFVDSICGMSYYFAHIKVVKSLPEVSQPSKENDHQKQIGTDQKHQVPDAHNPQPSGPERVDPPLARPVVDTLVKNSPVGAQQMKSLQEHSSLDKNLALVPKINQNSQQDETESKINPENEDKVPAIPGTAEGTHSDGSLIAHKPVAAAPVEAVAAEQPQKPQIHPEAEEPTDLKKDPDTGVDHLGPSTKGKDKEVNPVETDRPVKPPTEKNLEQNAHNSDGSAPKPEVPNNEGDKKLDNNPAGIESNNPDAQQDLEDDRTAQNQDIDGDEPEAPDGDNVEDQAPVIPMLKEKDSKPLQTDESAETIGYNTEMEGDSYFFTYFMLLCIIFIVGYVCYHNKQKILALILEGRKGRRQYRGRRPNSANYHKLDSNLEEAITSTCTKNTNNVIY